MNHQPGLAESTEAVNPYAPPQASITPGAADVPSDADDIRLQFLTHEASIRSVGGLYILGGVLGLFGTFFLLVGTAFAPSSASVVIIGLLVYGLFSGISIYLGNGLRALDPKVRLGTTILSVIGLIGFPLGTLINGYILYLLHSQKGKRVMTPEYQAIVAETPHIKYRTPLWLIILAALLIGLIVVLIIMAAQ